VGFLAGTLLVFAALLCIGLATFLADKAANRELPSIAKSLIGGLCGLLAEGLRMGFAAVVSALFFGAERQPGPVVAWLMAFRFMGIPLLVGFGVAAGAAAGQRQAVCPKCNGPLLLDEKFIQSQPSGGLSFQDEPGPHKEACAKCKAVVLVDRTSLRILGTEPDEQPRS
jgi:hypothetical protein